MKGDFSKWGLKPTDNFSGVLHQQGRVLLDQDWNASTQIQAHWREIAGRDVIGGGLVAVPVAAPDGLRILSATANVATGVDVVLHPGRAWVDGVHLYYESKLPLQALHAEYLTPPPAPTIAAGDRDAVIIEVWDEAFSAFQDPLELLEPALGGPDTTERVKTSMAVKLLRLTADQGCGDLPIDVDFASKGKLTVTPALTMVIAGPCPVPDSGGYTGFEHYLYRIEIATPNAANEARFKWSQFNGGLVGRGEFTAGGAPATGTVAIRANNQMINQCGLDSFYLEALAFDPAFGHWRIVCTANATLANADTLSLTIISGAWPAPSPNPNHITGFFRLWNGIDLVSNHPSGLAIPNPFNDGILLEFEPSLAGNTNYKSGDYWTFPVRSASVAFDPSIWPNASPPQGVHYHRVPLGILSWSSPANPAQIEDCRRVFDPLTDLRGCCIEVKPGDDIHRALKKLFDAGGGCLCLLPGDHVLTRPIDLTGRTSIHIRGFGPASRLSISSHIKTTPFILANARDITFESFIVINQAAAPLWGCRNTVRLRVDSVFALANLEARNQPVFALEGTCHSWRLEDNVFVGAIGLLGRLLASSAIFGNVWIGTRRGIDLVYAQELQLERNDFLGIRADRIKNIDAFLGNMATGATSFSSAKSLAHGILSAPNAAVAPAYIAVEIHGVFDVDIIDNEFFVAVGLFLEWVENGLVQRNRFRTLVAATVCGIAHGLRFSENRIGVAADDQTGQQAMACETGLILLADAVECRIVDNVFANVKQGVVFESDFGNKKAVARDFSANLYMAAKVTDSSAKELLADAEARTKEVSDKSLLLNSTFFRVGRSERVSIEGNQFHAATIGIEWSGTTQIFDFRIAGNAFIGCQDVAIQIEPDHRILLLADPVDTKVRLIENNRFEICSGAVRATIGAVRVEKNDIRISTPTGKTLAPKAILAAAADHIYSSASFAKAVKADDIPLAWMMAIEVAGNVEESPNVINAEGFSKDVGDNILKTYKLKKGDALADQVFVLKTLADLGANDYLATLGNALLPKWMFNAEGFIVNLAGVQNRFVHNRVYGNNLQRPGGVLFHTVSGEVRDNEIVVPGTALLLNGKLGLASGYQGAEVVGNSLAALGVPGSKTAVYALAIPSLSPGNLAINGNLFKGSVMIGGDPLSAQGFSKKDVFTFPRVFTFYNAMKYDVSTYAISTLIKVFPTKIGNVGVFKPPGIIFQIWQTDPHANRPVVHFCQNRVIQGWVGIFQALSGAYWSAALLKSQKNQALVANVANNVLDYGGSVVGHELVILGNYSQAALKYRVGGRVQAVANIPAAVSF